MTKILTFIFLWAPFCVAGQDNLMTMRAAVDSAFANNAILNQSRAIVEQKRNEWRTLTGVEAPEVSYFEEGKSSSATKPFEERRWTISQTIDFPLTTVYRLKALKQEAEAMNYLVQAQQNEIRAEVKSRYIDILYALHLQELGRQQKALADELYNAVYTKFETGMGNGIDLTKAELQVAEAENFQNEAERMLHMGRYSLFRLMGLEISEINYGILFSDTLNNKEVVVNQITALSVLHEQPEYLAAIAEQEATQNKIREAKSNILPDIRFNLYKQNYGDGFKYNGFEVGLSIPIWLPFEQSGKIKMAQARQTEIEWQQKGIEQAMKEQIEHAWHSYTSSKQIIDRYNQTMSAKSSRLQQLSIEAYRLGEIDLMNLILAQQTYLNNQERYLSALHDFYLQLTQLEKYLNLELVY
ncbi:TolC family protein [Mangrovibacterium lignilyticum]|uniref:TolC family protein n=1 Tax=Mangrovibacterium lignilyticum TaxID=2668052 RepID=UPI0013D7C11E|nr:TolC family protein [Mangrovibacterium lignilyticum]